MPKGRVARSQVRGRAQHVSFFCGTPWTRP